MPEGRLGKSPSTCCCHAFRADATARSAAIPRVPDAADSQSGTRACNIWRGVKPSAQVEDKMDGIIVQHTQLVAQTLGERYVGNPAGEVAVWATLAQQREAMVVALYDADAIERRLPKQPQCAVADVVRR